MDLHERHQIDMAERMQQVRKKAAPWRSIIALVLAIAGAVAAAGWGVPARVPFGAATETQRLITLAGAAAFGVFGLIAALGLSAKARSSLQPVIGQAHAGVIRYVIVLAGVFAILLIALEIGRVPVTQLLVGGAVAGVLLGIAAQQALSNVFAGLVLLFARPFRVGDHVRFRAGALGGTIEGLVTDVSLTYVRVDTDEGSLLLPNSQALAASILLLPDHEGEQAAG